MGINYRDAKPVIFLPNAVSSLYKKFTMYRNIKACKTIEIREKVILTLINNDELKELFFTVYMKLNGNYINFEVSELYKNQCKYIGVNS